MKNITIRGIIGYSDNATPKFLQDALAEAAGEDIEILFSSPGGYVYPGLEMANMIKNYSGKVVARITGLAASMSSYIPMMADEIIAEDNAVFMIHNVFGFGMGDFREVEKAAKHLKGLRDLLAKAYITKTGKEEKIIHGLMDDETFFYGEEIEENGFADQMVEAADDDDDKASALTKAQVEIDSCIAMLKENETQVADDFKKAAAFLDIEDVPSKPSAKAEKPKEVKMKNLKEILAATPEAQAEFDEAIKAAEGTARADGIATGKTEMKETYKAVSGFIGNDAYPKVIGETALKVLDGESTIAELNASVAACDAITEQKKEDEAKLENGVETPPEAPKGLSEDGTCKDSSHMAGAVASFNQDFGSGDEGGKE